MLWFGGGLAMFLVGMVWMRQGVVGSGETLRRILERATGTRWQAVLTGFLVTLVIQSSSATTILSVGLVGAGVMGFEESVGVILGANVGTTITAQLIRLMDIGQGSWLLAVFQAQNFAPVLWMAGGVLVIFCRSQRANSAGLSLVGLGLLFTGLLVMRQGVEPMMATKWFAGLLRSTLDNPLTGFSTGFAIAMVVQSSSAAVGILQTLCAAGADAGFWQIYPVLLGINIGGALATMLLGQLGAKGQAGKTAVSFLVINLLCSLINMLTVAVLQLFGVLSGVWDSTMNAGAIADLHTFLRTTGAVFLYPLLGQICCWLGDAGEKRTDLRSFRENA